MEDKIKYIAEGFVLGNYWGGGTGSYPTIKFEADTKEELLEKADKALEDGSIDSGMGYESLISAILGITKITTIEVDGKIFTNKETEEEFIGELNDQQADFLMECLFNN